MFVNRMPRYEILSQDAIETLDKGWRRIVSEIGVEFILPEAVEIFAKAGQKTEGDNVWLDPEGHLCAAATIINNSGNTDLAMSVPSMNNYLKLIDVTEGPLMDWILTSGFTQDEIAMIQEPFVGVRPQPIAEPPDGQRLAEDARLAKRYAVVEKALKKQRKASLDAAVDRLISENPELAASLVASM